MPAIDEQSALNTAIKHTVAVLALLLSIPAVHAADCQLKTQLPVAPLSSKPGDLFAAASTPVVTTSYRLGENFHVKVGDRVLRRQINPAGQSAVFSAAVRYRARLPLTASYVLEKDQPYTLLDVPQLPGVHALVLPQLHEGLDEYLFVDAHRQLCARVLTFARDSGKIRYRSNRYRATPDLAAHITTGIPDTARGQSIAITLTAITASQFVLDSQSSTDGKADEAQQAAFARDAVEFAFAGFQFQIQSVDDSTLSLSVVGEPDATP